MLNTTKNPARRARSTLTIAAALLAARSARAVVDTSTWDNTASSWSVPGHWAHSNGGAIGLVPSNGNGGFTYNVIISGGNVAQDIPAGVTIDGLAFGGGNIDGPNLLTISTSGDWTAGAMSGAGATTFGGTSTLSISGVSDKGLSRSVISSGVATWSGGRLNVTNGTFTNNNFFSAQADNTFENFGGANAFFNNGTFSRTVGAGFCSFNVPFNNSGTVAVSSGTLSFNAGGSSGGTFSSASGATLRFAGGTQAMTAARVSATGTVEFSGGTVTLDAATVYGVTGFTTVDGGNVIFGNSAATTGLNMTGGNVGGAGSFGVLGTATWSAGAMFDSGTTNFTGASALGISGGSDKGLSRNVFNNGVVTWIAGRMNVTNGTFTNNNRFDAQADNTFENFGGANAFFNTGTFTRTVGTGQVIMNIPFNNAGTVSVSSGVVSLNAGGNDSGTFSASPGSVLRFAGGTRVMTGAKLTGSGTIQFSGGTVNFDMSSVYTASNFTMIDGGVASFGNSASTAGLNFAAGAILGSGSFGVTGVATWTGGGMGDIGTTAFTSTSALAMAGPSDMGLSRIIVNDGATTWTGGRVNVSAGTFTNNNQFSAQADNTFENFGGSNAFNNNGTFTRAVGAGIASMNVPFNNSGTVAVSSGMLSLNAGGSDMGTFSTTAGSDLRFGGGAHTMTGARLSGSGTIEFLGGTANFNAGFAYSVSGFTLIDGGVALFGNPATTNGLNMSSGGIGGAGSLGVTGVATWTGGTMGETGTTAFASTCALTISGDADKGLSRNVTSSGPATWTAGRMNVSGGTFINNNVFDAQADNTFENFGGANAFNNNGTFTRTIGVGQVNMSIPFNNAGTVIISSGTLSLNAGGSSTGTFLAAGSTLRFGGGVHAVAGGRVSGTGIVQFSGGTTSFDAGSVYSVAGSTVIDGGVASFGNSASTSALNFSSGAITGSGSFGVTGIASWTGGGMGDTGTTAFTNTSALSISIASDKGLSRSVIGGGVTTWMAGRMNVTSGTFSNNGVFDAQADNTFENFGGVNAFNNNGTFTRTVGTGLCSFNIPFNNTGTVTASSGTLALNAGGSSSGTFVASSGATLRIGGGQTLSGTSSVSGPGTLEVNGGLNTFGGDFNVATTHVLSGVLRLAPGTNQVLRTQNLLIDGAPNAWSGRVDLADGDAIIDYTGAGNSSIATIRNQIKNGFAGGGWSGNGIATSLGDTTRGLGYVEASQKFSTFPATFSGQAVDSTAVLIKYTYRGDADLDGDADGVDIGTWATNFTGELGGTGSMVWTQGDWDYDGDVDGVDAGLWAQAFTGELGGAGLGSPVVNDPNIAPGAAAILRGMGITVVPEPASLALLLAYPYVQRLRKRKRAARATGGRPPASAPRGGHRGTSAPQRVVSGPGKIRTSDLVLIRDAL